MYVLRLFAPEDWPTLAKGWMDVYMRIAGELRLAVSARTKVRMRCKMCSHVRCAVEDVPAVSVRDQAGAGSYARQRARHRHHLAHAAAATGC